MNNQVYLIVSIVTKHNKNNLKVGDVARDGAIAVLKVKIHIQVILMQYERKIQQGLMVFETQMSDLFVFLRDRSIKTSLFCSDSLNLSCHRLCIYSIKFLGKFTTKNKCQSFKRILTRNEQNNKPFLGLK